MEKWRAKAGSGVETEPEGLELTAVMTIIIRDTDYNYTRHPGKGIAQWLERRTRD